MQNNTDTLTIDQVDQWFEQKEAELLAAGKTWFVLKNGDYVGQWLTVAEAGRMAAEGIEKNSNDHWTMFDSTKLDETLNA